MKTLEEIKDEYAQHNYGESWFSWTCGGSDISNSDLDAVAKRFAIEVAKEALKNASESIDQDKLEWRDFYDFSLGVETVPNTDNIESILSESNIPQL